MQKFGLSQYSFIHSFITVFCLSFHLGCNKFNFFMNGISSIIGISGRTAVQANFKLCIIDFNLSFLATQALPVHPGIKENQDVADTMVDTILVRCSWQRSGRQAT